jgi:hypothetical protein
VTKVPKASIAWPQSKEHTMQILCTTKQAAYHGILLLMTAEHLPIDVYSSSPEETLSPLYTITLFQPLDVTLRVQIEQIPDTRIIVA